MFATGNVQQARRASTLTTVDDETTLSEIMKSGSKKGKIINDRCFGRRNRLDRRVWTIVSVLPVTYSTSSRIHAQLVR